MVHDSYGHIPNFPVPTAHAESFKDFLLEQALLVTREKGTVNFIKMGEHNENS